MSVVSSSLNPSPGRERRLSRPGLGLRDEETTDISLGYSSQLKPNGWPKRYTTPSNLKIGLSWGHHLVRASYIALINPWHPTSTIPPTPFARPPFSPHFPVQFHFTHHPFIQLSPLVASPPIPPGINPFLCILFNLTALPSVLPRG